MDLAIELGVPAERINTIIDFDAARRHPGVSTRGTHSVAEPATRLAEVARLVAGGAVELPVAATFGLDDVRAAYEELAARHTRGKIVLTMG